MFLKAPSDKKGSDEQSCVDKQSLLLDAFKV